MKKILLMVTALVALSLVSCDNSNKSKVAVYKAKAEQLAARMDELCNQQDTLAILAMEDSIRAFEQEVENTGDIEALDSVRLALKETRQRNSAYITTLKIDDGMDREKAVQDVINDALYGDVGITTVTETIHAAYNKEEKK